MYRNTRSRGFHRSRKSSGRRFSGSMTGKYINPARFVNKPSETNSNKVYEPINSFENFNLPSILIDNIVRKGYMKPTPIQDKAIPHLREGKDVIGIANTGTGKTAAFLIPLIEQMFKDGSTKALIVAPTRELAVQIEDEFLSFTEGTQMYSVLVIGGSNMARQKMRIRRGFNIVVATPGRLIDHVKQNSINLQEFSKIVLDEVDRMVDIGFIHDVKYIISRLPKQRQSLFFSATIGNKESEILRNFVSNPIKIEVRTQDTAETVEQDVVRIESQKTKIETLHNILIQAEVKKVLIFGRTKWGVDKLSKKLQDRGFNAGTIHGGKSQSSRQRTLDMFRDNKLKILTATDVASRGIDVDDITHVINYDRPETYDDYVHRIGRTGRANKKGMALTFLE
jgi:ATP-dependent RNA helicase RhlE